MVLTVSFALSSGTGLSCPRRFADHFTKLDASVGASGPHDFAVRLTRYSSKAPKRPPHPAPNVRDDRETPLMNGRETAALMQVIWLNCEAKYFFAKDWTGSISLNRKEKSNFWRKDFCADYEPRSLRAKGP